MSWLVAALSLGLAAAPEGPDGAGAQKSESTVVLVGRRTAVTAPITKALASDAYKLLAAQGVSLALTNEEALKQLTRVSVKDSASCNGKKACLAELGRQLKVPWVVVMSVAGIENELSVGLELVRVNDETVVETDSLILPRKGKLDASQLSGFVQKVKARLSPPLPDVKKDDLPKQDDAPVVTDLTPKKVEEPLLPPPAPPEQKSRVPSFVLGGAGVASLLAGAAMLTVGLVSRGPLTQGTPGADGRVRSTLTQQQAQAINDGSNPLIFGGLGALAVGAGLGTAAVIAW